MYDKKLIEVEVYQKKNRHGRPTRIQFFKDWTTIMITLVQNWEDFPIAKGQVQAVFFIIYIKLHIG